MSYIGASWYESDRLFDLLKRSVTNAMNNSVRQTNYSNTIIADYKIFQCFFSLKNDV